MHNNFVDKALYWCFLLNSKNIPVVLVCKLSSQTLEHSYLEHKGCSLQILHHQIQIGTCPGHRVYILCNVYQGLRPHHSVYDTLRARKMHLDDSLEQRLAMK